MQNEMQNVKLKPQKFSDIEMLSVWVQVPLPAFLCFIFKCRISPIKTLEMPIITGFRVFCFATLFCALLCIFSFCKLTFCKMQNEMQNGF